MKPIYINAVFFSEEKVMFPLKSDPLRYFIQYTPRIISEESLKKIKIEELKALKISKKK